MLPTFHLYGLFIGLGIILGLWLASKIQKKLGNWDQVYLDYDLDNVLMWIIIPGIIGARLYHVIDYWNYYQSNLLEAIMLWHGGLGIYGAILGGFIGLWLFNKSKKNNILIPLDIIAFALPISQAIGRLGNFVNQELYGLPTTLPWGIWIDPSHRVQQYLQFNYFHPIFAYEALANLILVFLMLKIVKVKHQHGFYIGLYLIGYSLIRFSLDFLRIDPWKIGILSTAQWISLCLFILGIGLIKFNPR